MLVLTSLGHILLSIFKLFHVSVFLLSHVNYMNLSCPLMPAKYIYHSINSIEESLVNNFFFCHTMLYTPPSPCFLCPSFFTFWYFPAPPQLLHRDVLVLSVKITVFIGLVLLHVLYDKLQKNKRITLLLRPQENNFLRSSSCHIMFYLASGHRRLYQRFYWFQKYLLI